MADPIREYAEAYKEPPGSKDFWEQVHRVASEAGRAYLATIDRGRPKVRVVFPGFESERVWIATKPSFAKTRQIEFDPHVELFWETGASRPAPHLTVTGTARLVTDACEKVRVCNAKVFGYDLAEFWPKGAASEDLILIEITPSRVELGWQPAMWSGEKPLIWRSDGKQ